MVKISKLWRHLTLWVIIKTCWNKLFLCICRLLQHHEFTWESGEILYVQTSLSDRWRHSSYLWFFRVQCAMCSSMCYPYVTFILKWSESEGHNINVMEMFIVWHGGLPTFRFQYSVTLQSEEIISDVCRKKSSQGTTVNSYCKHHEFCLHTKKTHISLPVPLTATPGFITDVGTHLLNINSEPKGTQI